MITGAAGQLGTDLALHIQKKRPAAHILLTDLRVEAPQDLAGFDYRRLDVTDWPAFDKALADFGPTEIYHLAALLSGTAEKNPELAWQLNVQTQKHLFDVCVQTLPGVKVFFPSSIAVFGPGAGKYAQQKAYLDPTSMYGVTKVAGEQLGNYYHFKYGLDVRSLRFPGLISSKAMPGGGTTDYSVEIYHVAQRHDAYTCYLRADTPMPFLYMPDAMQAVEKLMAAPAAALQVRTSYNIHGFSATPQDFAASIAEALGKPFELLSEPDFRQAIADSWPAELEDAAARQDWGWQPAFDLKAVTADMLTAVAEAKQAV